MSLFEWEIKYNYGLGLLPVSLFVNLTSELLDDINIYNKVFDEITNFNTRDVIFHGMIKENETSLQWLLPRLIFNTKSFHTAVIMRNELSPHILPQSFILEIEEPINAKQMFPLLERLRETDVLVVLPQSTDFLVFVRNTILQKEIKVGKFFYVPNEEVATEQVLKEEIYDIIPCFIRR